MGSRTVERLGRLRETLASRGPRHAATLYGLKLRARLAGGAPYITLTAPTSRYPLYCRPRSTDLMVYEQIFLDDEYACVGDIPDPSLVVDCGANVGYSAAYFLTRYPGCRVVAVEPDPGNFEVLRKNLDPYGDRVRAVRAGVWSHPARLAIREAPYRGGGEWARQVRECREGEEGGIPAVDIATLLEESGRPRISVLKMDIEGAEAVVFAGDCGAWIDRVDLMLIELHDDTAFGDTAGPFARAVEGRFDVTHPPTGELKVCRRIAAGRPGGSR